MVVVFSIGIFLEFLGMFLYNEMIFSIIDFNKWFLFLFFMINFLKFWDFLDDRSVFIFI